VRCHRCGALTSSGLAGRASKAPVPPAHATATAPKKRLRPHLKSDCDRTRKATAAVPKKRLRPHPKSDCDPPKTDLTVCPPPSAAFAKLGEELGGCDDGQVVREAEEVLVTRDEKRAPADGEREQIIVAWVR
jgi:hypothetical protein